jgi:DNA (cytosine-5)-methyltransferase 1
MQRFASVIDLFAGPGGLGEGFSAFSSNGKVRPFQIEMSVEKESSAHKTLELRAFFRQFIDQPPDEYYRYLRGEVTREELFDAYPQQAANAAEETLGGPRTLGNDKDDRLIHQRVKQLSKDVGPWVVIGGPPCQAYSLVGRNRNVGKKDYRAEEDNRHFLYEEYLKVLWSIRPEIFVMENVKGILSSKINGQTIFPRILEDLSHPGKALKKRGGKGYKIYSLAIDQQHSFLRGAETNFIVRAENHGIPQARHRVILLGVREDIEKIPQKLDRKEEVFSAGSVIDDLPSLRSGLSKGNDSPEAWHFAVREAATKVARGLSNAGLDSSNVEAIVEKATRYSSRGSQFVKKIKKFRGPEELDKWYSDKRLGGFVNHETRGHIVEDLARYMFCAAYAKESGGISPTAKYFPETLTPNHANWNSGKFVDRFKVQSKNRPSSTITSHISKDGHYFIHYDPSQCRSLTVREAARLQTFPDNYLFEGNRTQQYVQVGNAVPPFLAIQIAEVVYDLLR